MPDETKSCAVALAIQRNRATPAQTRATSSATANATQSLRALSARVLARNQRNMERNLHATEELHRVAPSATPYGFNSTYESSQLKELQRLIKATGQQLNATEEEIQEMIQETLLQHPIQTALVTFYNLANELKISFFKLVNQPLQQRRSN